MPHGPHTAPARRVGVLLQAAVLILSLYAAPALHRKHCNGVCATRHLAAASEAPQHSCCGGAEHQKGSKGDDGCQCLGDCCSIFGHCATPTVVCDTAPPIPTLPPVPALQPDETSRAPEAWLLPYPTGPPSAA